MNEDYSKTKFEPNAERAENVSSGDSANRHFDADFRADKFFSLLVAGFAVVHLFVALPLAAVLNVWADEASTVYTTGKGFAAAVENALADERQAPLYFWILSLWREIDSSVFFGRLFSIVCSLLAIKFFYRLAKKLFDPKAAVFAAAFFAVHPYLIWASLEMRVYSLVVLLSVLLMNFFYDGYLNADENAETKATAQKKARLFYALTATVALYTNYYLGFALVGGFAALVAAKKWRAARIYFLQMAIVGAAFAPLIWAVKQQFAVNAGYAQPEKSFIEGIKILWNFFLTFAVPTEIFTPDEISPVSFFRLWLMRFAVVAAAFFLIVKKWKSLDRNVFAFGALTATIAAGLLVAYFLLGVNYVEIRHASVLFAPLVLLLALVARKIFPARGDDGGGEEARRNGKKGVIFAALAAAFFAFFFAYSLYTLYPNFSKRGDWARVARHIERNEKPNQPIIVSTPFEALALPVHYRGVNKIFPDERFFDYLGAAPEASDAKTEMEFVISEIPPDAEEVWLATGENCEISDACAPLVNFVRANYTIVEEKDFYKEKLFLLRKKYR